MAATAEKVMAPAEEMSSIDKGGDSRICECRSSSSSRRGRITDVSLYYLKGSWRRISHVSRCDGVQRGTRGGGNLVVVEINLMLISSYINSLKLKCVPAGTKNSLPEDFLLAKHKDTNIPTMMEPFSSPAAWFWLTSVPHPLDKAVVKGFNIKL